MPPLTDRQRAARALWDRAYGKPPRILKPTTVSPTVSLTVRVRDIPEVKRELHKLRAIARVLRRQLRTHGLYLKA